MIFELAICLTLGAALGYALYKWATINKDYFTSRNLKVVKFPFSSGNAFSLVSKKYIPKVFLDMIYYQYPNEKLIGMFDMRTPFYFIRDKEFIKQITIKDFDYFEDHQSFVNSDADSLFGNALTALEGKKWRDMRATLSPAFTGSKMRNMFELITECADDLTKFLMKESKEGKLIRWEMRELCSRYTNDVIASCAFGLKVNSLEDPSNEFFVLGKDNLKAGNKGFAIRLLLIKLFPSVMKWLGVEIFPVKVKQFFRSMILDTMKERDAKGIIRHDMINILMQVRKGNLKHNEDDTQAADAGFATVQESEIGHAKVKRTWNDDEIVAQCFVFFLAGFDSVSTLLSFLTYELAVNQDIQQKLYEEIFHMNEQLNETRLSYDNLQKMKYLDQVISETLRKWPPALLTNRQCSKDYVCELDGQEKFLIEKGKYLWIPIISIHYDPSFYPEPEKFDPERFNDENKHLIHAGTYLPFGVGPRNCIGSRFALMEVKALMFYLLLKFNIRPYEETQVPLKMAKSPFNLLPENGIRLEFKPRLNSKDQ